MSPLRALIENELTNRGLDGVKFTEASARVVADAVSGLARFSGSEHGIIPEAEREEAACASLKSTKRRSRPEASTVTGLLMANFGELLPAYAAKLGQELGNAGDPESAKARATTLVSRLRTAARLFASRGWIESLGEDPVENPLSEKVNWIGIPVYAAWRAREEARVADGSRSENGFRNLASRLHSFLDVARQRSCGIIDPDSEAKAWNELKRGVTKGLPRVDGKPTVSEYLVLHAEELLSDFETRNKKSPSQTRILGMTAARSLLSLIARECPKSLKDEALTSLGVSREQALPPLAILTFWSTTLSEIETVQRALRLPVRKFAHFVMSDAKLITSETLEEEAFAAAGRAAKSGGLKLTAIDPELRNTVTIRMLSQADDYATRYARQVTSDSSLGHREKSQRLLATRRFLVWAREKKLCQIKDESLLHLAPKREAKSQPTRPAASPKTPRVKTPRSTTPRSKTRGPARATSAIPEQKRQRAKKTTPPNIGAAASKREPGSQSGAAAPGPHAKGAQLKVSPPKSPQAKATQNEPSVPVDPRLRVGYTFVAERFPLLNTKDRLARMKELATLEAIVRSANEPDLLPGLITAKTCHYFPNLARLQIKQGHSLEAFTLNPETNSLLRDYCETAASSPLGKVWGREPDTALLFPGEDGRPLFNLECPAKDRQIPEKLMRSCLVSIGGLLRCEARSLPAAKGALPFPVTFRLIAALRPGDLQVEANRFLIRDERSGKPNGEIKLPPQLATFLRDVSQALRVSEIGSHWDAQGADARLFTDAAGNDLLAEAFE